MHLGPNIFGVHYALFAAFGVETNRKKFSWFVELYKMEFFCYWLGLVLHRSGFRCMMQYNGIPLV